MSTILYFTEPKNRFDRRTRIFWNIDDVSIFKTLDPHSIFREFKNTIRKEGYRDIWSIDAYVDEDLLPEKLLEECCQAKLFINVAPKAQGVKRLDLLFVSILTFANNCLKGSPSNMLVISKDVGQGTKYARFLEAAQSQFLNVGVADSQIFLDSVRRAILHPKVRVTVCCVCKKEYGPLQISKYVDTGLEVPLKFEISNSTSSTSSYQGAEVRTHLGLCDDC